MRARQARQRRAASERKRRSFECPAHRSNHFKPPVRPQGPTPDRGQFSTLNNSSSAPPAARAPPRASPAGRGCAAPDGGTRARRPPLLPHEERGHGRRKLFARRTQRLRPHAERRPALPAPHGVGADAALPADEVVAQPLGPRRGAHGPSECSAPARAERTPRPYAGQGGAIPSGAALRAWSR